MKKVLTHIHLPTFIAGSVVIFIAGLAAVLAVLNPQPTAAFMDLFKKPFESVDISISSSSVEITKEQNMLRFQFKIRDEDRQSFERVSTQLGVGNQWQQGISFGLDEQSMGLIVPYLPLHSNVKVEGNTIVFSGGGLDFLPSGASGEKQLFATDGATLIYDSEGSISLQKPNVLLNYATASGKLNVSRKIQADLFSIAEKVDTIDLEIKGKSLEGKIILK